MRLSGSRGVLLAAVGVFCGAFVWEVAVQPAAPALAVDLPGTTTTMPRWIWADQARPDQTVYFRKEFPVKGRIAEATLIAACDNTMSVYLDGKLVAEGDRWETPVIKDVAGSFRATGRPPANGGRHVLAVRGKNTSGSAGLLVRLVLEAPGQEPVVLVTDATWKVSDRPQGKDWAEVAYDDASWGQARSVGELGKPPWAKVNDRLLAAIARSHEPTATPLDRLKVHKGFKVELLYSVPQIEQGSWVCMTIDAKARLIVSDQYGKLYRVTPPPIGTSEGTLVEPIDVEVGGAHGLQWAFDSLYVVNNEGGKFTRGLYRVRDTDGDDRLDKVELLREIKGGGEHGPHAVVPGPDGKSLYVIAGNATAPVEVDASLVPRVFGEDQLLPRLPDGRGFMRDETAPGGCVYRVDPDGKRWELVSMGYRNAYDMAFNRDGELFTYDSDMEWDMNLPWYRPTRVCQAVSGSDFGYRGGSGKWPTYFPDSLPPTINIGPGSPTGVSFGYGAKFPAKYQEALFISDWSYGKLYAVHLKPTGASYTAELEEFITGTPLPLTDLAINPKDGAMYFAIGGRRTQSGLYRVTYTGSEPTAPAPKADDAGTEARTLRHRLEAFHGHADPRAVEASWPHLGSPDRFIRWAARVAIEFQDSASWRERALAESNPEAALTGLLALVRVSASDPVHRKRTDPAPDPALKARILDALDRLSWEALSPSQRLELLRVYAVLFNRMGPPDPEAASRVIARFDPSYPARSPELNAELCKLLIYLQAPDAASKTMALLEKAPTQEEQIEYAKSLRMLRAGWTPSLRKEAFSWFQKAAGFRGGNSFGGFMNFIKGDAIATLSEAEKAELKPIIEAPAAPTASTPIASAPPRPFVKSWTVDELAPVVERGIKGGRDFDRGRTLFAAAQCFSCHRTGNEGGAFGPDLTGVSGRFSVRDLLESIILPSKTISDQYEAVMIATADGRALTGRIVNLAGNNITINTNMLDPNALTSVSRRDIEEMKPSPVSMMPEGLLSTLHEEEVSDLIAYLLSRGDRENPMFQPLAR